MSVVGVAMNVTDSQSKTQLLKRAYSYQELVSVQRQSLVKFGGLVQDHHVSNIKTLVVMKVDCLIAKFPAPFHEHDVKMFISLTLSGFSEE